MRPPGRPKGEYPSAQHDDTPESAFVDGRRAVVLDALLDAVWIVEAASLKVVAANTAAGDLLEIDHADIVGRNVISLVAAPEDLVFWCEAMAGLDNEIVSDTLVRSASGKPVPVTRRVSAVDYEGRPSFVVAMRDRRAEVRADAERDTLVAELRATLESTADGILVTDLNGAIRSFNARFAAMWEIPAELLTHRNDDAVLDWMRRCVTDDEGYQQRLWAIAEAPLLQTSDVLNLRSGRIIERVTMPQWSRGRAIGRVYSFRDISERLAAEARIETLAQNDVLTGLPNRRLLAARIDHAIAMARRDGVRFALLALGLDRFRHINETLGQSVGDLVLVEVAERLRGCLRQVDTVSRFSGDEFCLLIHHAEAAGAQTSVERIMAAMATPFAVDDLTFTVTCSIGIALYPSDGITIDDLVGSAVRAMRAVKESGRASWRFHRPEKERDLRWRMRLDHAMRQALASDRFRLHYQPQIELDGGRLIGAEALIRWRDPELGDIAPGEFIPVAEESGFIAAIGDWVLTDAVRQASSWHASGWPLPVAINVSALQFQRPDFVDRVAAAIQSANLPPQLLELELTESILLHDADDALARLKALAALGVSMSVDDFGTGYSSLGYLKRFPLQRLKIDRSFVRGLPDDQSDLGIVSAIVNLGRALKLRVIAEGVETEPQRRALLEAGCDEFQGFLFAPALDVATFEKRFAPTVARVRRVV